MRRLSLEPQRGSLPCSLLPASQCSTGWYLPYKNETLRSKVSKYWSVKDGRGALFELDLYQTSQGSFEASATDAWEKLNGLQLTSTYSRGGTEVFFRQWDEAIKRLKDVNQAPNEFLERTNTQEGRR